MKTLIEIVRAEAQAREELRKTQETIRKQENVLRALKEERRSLPGLSPAQERIACACLDIRGNWANAICCYEQARNQLRKVIERLANDECALQDRYVGCKEYGCWRCQAVECIYGYIPRRGTVWLYIGLTPEKREAGKLTPDEQAACVAFLSAIQEKGGAK